MICPGIHQPDLSESFRVELLDLISHSSVSQKPANILVYPGQDFLVLSAFHILQFLRVSKSLQLKSPIIFISFSAGVIGAIGAAYLWQLLGGHVKAF
ncbi:MAG: hypothetical protein ACYTX0_59970, partial [Nostoc sp.]